MSTNDIKIIGLMNNIVREKHYEKSKKGNKMREKLCLGLIVLLIFSIYFGLCAGVIYSYQKELVIPGHGALTTPPNDLSAGAGCAQNILECEKIVGAPIGNGYVNQSNLSSASPCIYPGVWNVPANDSSNEVQFDIYEFIKTNNTTCGVNGPGPNCDSPWYTDPDGLRDTLACYDTRPGLTYNIHAFDNEDLACKKIAYTVSTYEVPPAVYITYENYSYWIIVDGVESSVPPTSDGTYTITKFRIHDPFYLPIGNDKWISFEDFKSCYFEPVDASLPGVWDNKYVCICDPVEVSGYLTYPEGVYSVNYINQIGAKWAAVEIAKDFIAQNSPGFKEALIEARPGHPVKVEWACGGNCWAVPFVKDNFLSAVIIVDEINGRFREATYAPVLDTDISQFYHGLTYPFVTREIAGVSLPAAVKIEDDNIDVIKINFGPQGATVPNGYLADTGEAFGVRGNGYTYGWNMDYYGDERNSHIDQRLDTLIYMQQIALWQISLENGNYKVFVVCGDPSLVNQINNIEIEGHVMNDPDPWDMDPDNLAGSDFDEYEVTVDVIDGHLTIKTAEGALNAKICFVHIEHETTPDYWWSTVPPYPSFYYTTFYTYPVTPQIPPRYLIYYPSSYIPPIPLYNIFTSSSIFYPIIPYAPPRPVYLSYPTIPIYPTLPYYFR